MNEQISVIVPVYNVERYLPQCIDSIRNQSHKNIEIILIDDGSTDNSGEICDKYLELDTRISVIHQKNKGISEARNCGLQRARGQYVAFVDSDDIIESNMYEVLLTALKKSDADIAICRHRKLDEQGNIIDVESPIENEVLSGKDIIQRIPHPISWHYVLVWNKLYKREIFNNIQFVTNKIHEDEFIFHEICLHTRCAVSIAAPLYIYRMTPNSIMRKKHSIKNLDSIEAAYRAFKDCEGEHNEFLDYMYLRALQGVRYFNDATCTNKAERDRVKEVKTMLRYMYFHSGNKKSFMNFFKSFMPVFYVKFKRLVKK